MTQQRPDRPDDGPDDSLDRRDERAGEAGQRRGRQDPDRRRLRAVTPPDGLPTPRIPGQRTPGQASTGPDDLTGEPAAGLGAGDVESGARGRTDDPILDPAETGKTGEPVDPPAGKVSTTDRYRAAREAELRPVVPDWLASAAAVRDTARWARRYYGHKAAYRAVRMVVDVPRLAWWTARGGAQVSWKVTRWVMDFDGHPLLGEVIARDDRAYVRMAYDRTRRQKWRFTLLGVLSLVALLALVVLADQVGGWAVALVALVVAALLARKGKPADVPVLSGASVSKKTAPRLTSQAIVTALGGLGIAALAAAVKAGRTSEFFPRPIVRVRTGWLSEIDLPYGVTAAEIGERRAKLASGLRRPLGAVWPEGDPSPDAHEGRLKLYVLDAPLSQLPQPPWPLARTGSADIFKPLPYGFDTKGDPVNILLMYSNLLEGAIPRQGKTFSLRVLVLGASLDVTVEIHAHELKGTGDLECVQAIAHRYTSGPARDEDLQSVMASIREVHGYLEPRALTISRLPAERCPEKKVTRDLANDPALGLHPVLLVVDEVQELFDSEYAAEAEQLLKAIIKRGPALGIMLILATQKPDAKSLPTSIASNMGLRLCLRVADQVANDMILGTSAYKIGMNATLFTDTDKGVGLLRDGGPAARTVRASYLDGGAALRIGKRALALRSSAGRLTGDAAGQRIETQDERLAVVADVVTHWPLVKHADASAWLHEIEATLATEDPDRYAGLESPWLGARLRALGIPTQEQRKRRIDGEQINRAGVTLRDLQKVLEGPTG